MTMPLMYREALQAPKRMRIQLNELATPLERLVKHLHQHPPKLVVVCGRGSSDHAGVYLRYLIELGLGIPTTSATPSILSIYGTETNLSDSLVILISQSGQSPDLVNYAQMAKRRGAFTLGLINSYENAPLSAHCDVVLPLHAGIEQSVAATKSYVCTLMASLQLVAAWSGNEALQAALQKLPDDVAKVSSLDWSMAMNKLVDTRRMLVLGRGPGRGIANESALKFKETCSLHAEAFSSAEVLHGPLAMIGSGFPVLVFDQGDAASMSIRESVSRLTKAGADVLFAGANAPQGTTGLPVLEGLHPWCALVTQIQSAYLMTARLSLQRGYNPDAPQFIAKVTKTL
ncbi:MAG: SIS domain-containing protein [Thiofilum sp.]|uniref:SIS domain-containing protein n=1 Tax=Thiofilum sp. TaxID=2212733 RepID=UPI0025DA2C85|nr:SIS domain-containing protein [Thiofilum sp.]MBK8454783.1 SIS domain-containing protein [Thiofilum sp.]